MGKTKKAGDGLIDIDPDCIRFTHARIRPYFTGCGRRVEDTLADIIAGKMSINDLPKITVILNQGTYFSLNNRRLYVLKDLRLRGLLPGNVIGARVKEALEREKDRYKIERCSLVARIMKENSAEGKDPSEADIDAEDLSGSDKDIEDEEVKKESHSRSIDKAIPINTKNGVETSSPKPVIEKTKNASKKKKGSSKRRADSSDDDF
jgi:hypothetical protein